MSMNYLKKVDKHQKRTPAVITKANSYKKSSNFLIDLKLVVRMLNSDQSSKVLK